jgi:cytochrome subunit of sulfide dehydrogenase
MIGRAVFGVLAVLGIVSAAPSLDAVAAPPMGAVSAPPRGASSCSGCHGAGAPAMALKGRDAAEIVADMDAFRSGTRPATVMDRIAKGFSQDETVAIAIWLAGQK